jgi:hypothetical protein
MLMSDLRSFTLWARGLLTKEAGELLQQVYRLDAKTGVRLSVPMEHLLETSTEAQAIRQRIEKLLDDEVDAGLKREEAVAKLIKETAFTHLNRFVAFKLMEARGLVRSPLARRHEANGFKMWLGCHADEEALYNSGDSPNDRDGFGEAPRDRAYRHFLLWQSEKLAEEINVLFDSKNLPSLLFPRPNALKDLIDALNDAERAKDWAAGNEATVGWVYQYFNSEELEAAFTEARLSGKKFSKEDIPSVTQLFTPRPTVRFLVDNTLGRLWLRMHPDSQLQEHCPYLTPLPLHTSSVPSKPVREIRILDPATGTMHFGLIAFELLVEMYREEIANAGTEGWPAEASVQSEREIPASILANNLFGVDIDLRAVQLAALALYLKAKSTERASILTGSNLACADVVIFRGQHLEKITNEMALPGGVTRELFVKFRDSLEEASMMGSLVRLEQHFQNFQSDLLRQSIDGYVEKKRREGVDESYFAHETGKGLRLLELLERRYDIVFTNPPYVSARKMNPEMSRFMKAHYKNAKGDLYAAFIQRCLELTSDTGVMGMLTMHSFMFISSYEKLRILLGENAVVESVAHYGPGLFAVGNPGTLQTSAFVLRREQMELDRREARGVYFRLVKELDAESKHSALEQALERSRSGESDPRVYRYRQGDFAAIPRGPWVYWIRPGLRELFRVNPKMQSLSKPCTGINTNGNERFVRFWWEVGCARVNKNCKSRGEAVERGGKWFPYMKGGSFKRWWGNQDLIVNWFRDGEEIKALAVIKNAGQHWSRYVRSIDKMFLRGITYTDLTTGRFSARLSPGGFVFDVSGSCLFPEQPEQVLGLMNSTWSQYALKIINPTVHVQTGDLARLPLPLKNYGTLQVSAERAVMLAQADSQEDEATYDFIAPPAWLTGVEDVTQRHRELAALESEIDEEVFRLYEITPEDRRAIEDELSTGRGTEDAEDDTENEVEMTDEPVASEEKASLTLEELAQSWVAYAVGVALGRFQAGEQNSLGRGNFMPDVNRTLRDLACSDGLMVVQRDHPDDLAGRVVAILSAIHGETEAAKIVRRGAGGNSDLRDALANYLLGPFFKIHVKRYRKRPIYWLLQSARQSYSIYLFQDRASDQTLAQLQGNRYLGGRIFQLQQQLSEAKAKEMAAEGREKAQWKKKAQDAAEELGDVESMQQAIDSTNNEAIVDAEGRSANARWIPEFDDGVLLNASPLYRMAPAWKKADAKLDLQNVWENLAKDIQGKAKKYAWAKTALRYWPRETLAACKDNKSYRIAHGLE